MSGLHLGGTQQVIVFLFSKKWQINKMRNEMNRGHSIRSFVYGSEMIDERWMMFVDVGQGLNALAGTPRRANNTFEELIF